MTYPKDYENRILCGDCLELMKGIPDGAVDLVFVDPPFNTGGRMGRNNRRCLEYANNNLTEKEYQQFTLSWFTEARRISKRLLVTPGVAHIWRYLKYLWCIVISKPSSTGFNRFGGFNCWEPLLVYDKPCKRIPRDVVSYDAKHFSNDGLSKHPCPDSLEMVRWVVDTWSKPGELVMDPMVGSGTTCVAAKQLGRKWIGMEISENYCEIARERLKQQELF